MNMHGIAWQAVRGRQDEKCDGSTVRILEKSNS